MPPNLKFAQLVRRNTTSTITYPLPDGLKSEKTAREWIGDYMPGWTFIRATIDHPDKNERR
jgi:hypothetical protein